MSDAIIVSLITGGISLIGIVATYQANAKKITQEFERTSAATDAKLELKLAVVETEIKNLTAEVRRHNNFAERVPALEQKVKDIDDRLKG